MFFTFNLNWMGHVPYLRDKTNIIRVLFGNKWGSDPASLFILYSSIILSRFDNGCEILKPFGKKVKENLDGILYLHGLHEIDSDLCRPLERWGDCCGIYNEMTIAESNNIIIPTLIT